MKFPAQARHLALHRSPLVVALVVTLVYAPLAAHAGRNCNETPPDAVQTQKAIQLARQVRGVLEANGVNVAALGRIGSDQSKRGVRYTHVGYIVRNHPAGTWTVVHELNSCGSGTSDLYDEGLANFYMDDPFEYETRIVIPSPEQQEKLAKTLLGPRKRALHDPTYSSIAYPWSTSYQNSNGWILETYAAATEPDAVSTRTQAQAWLREHQYQPSRIHIGAGERAGARLFTPNIRFGDHPDTAWQSQTYEVSTGDSTLDFLRRADPGARELVQRLDAKAVTLATVATPPPARQTNAVAERPQPAAPATSADAAPPTAVAPLPAPAAGQQPAVAASAAPAPAPAPAAPPAMPATGGGSTTSRSQLLQSMQGLIASYACRAQGYLHQCRQIERPACDKQVADAVLRCFATVSDQQLNGASEQAAMQQMQEIGYCAVEGIDAGFAGQPARTAQGQPCPKIRDYR